MMTEDQTVSDPDTMPENPDPGMECALGPRIYPTRPFVGVGVVVFRGDNVLLVRRGKPPRQGQWSLPGGAQHVGETVEQAARREVREETGLDVRLTGLVDVLDFIDHDHLGAVRHHYTLIDWMAESEDGDACAADDVTDAMWVPLDELDAHALWEETRRIILTAATMRKGQTRP